MGNCQVDKACKEVEVDWFARVSDGMKSGVNILDSSSERVAAVKSTSARQRVHLSRYIGISPR